MLRKSLVYGQIRQLNIFMHWYSSPLLWAPEVSLTDSLKKKKPEVIGGNAISNLSWLSYV